ncbi:cation:proton antiporter [Candidatus Woesearchaeota archaeon]|nr:cation:proton antiporter [Candidatus Woesearchaeota archaeon]
MDALLVLTNIAIILLLGILCAVLSKRLKIPNVLVLVVLGILLSRIMYNGQPLFNFDPTFLVGIGALALVMIVFDGSSRLRLSEVNAFSLSALKLIGHFLLFSIVLITLFTTLMFFESVTAENILFALIFSVIIVGTDPDAIFSLFQDYKLGKAKRVFEMLEIEAIANTPLIVILPFIILDLIRNLVSGNGDLFSSFMAQVPVFLAQIIVGVGAGVVIGIIVFKSMQKFYSEQFSPVGIITAALLAYVTAEQLKGNGVLAVATLGLLFGNVYVKEKPRLQEFSYMLSNALEILVFVLVGVMVKIPLSPSFIFKSLFLFALLVLSRLAAVFACLKGSSYSFKEKLFISFNMPKGIAVAVVAFTFSLSTHPQMSIILNLVLAIMIYSLILATVVERLSGSFIKVEPQGNIDTPFQLSDAYSKKKAK